MKNKAIRNIIISAALNSKYYERDFFPLNRLKTKEGRFELLALSVLDVRGFDADILWYEVGVELRKKNVLNIKYLLSNNNSQIKRDLKKAGYNRGDNYLNVFPKRLKKLATMVKEKYDCDISKAFNTSNIKNNNDVIELIDELDLLPGVGQKIATMFLKFMVSTFNVWRCNGLKPFIGISIPNDFQVRKVFLRLGNDYSKNIENSYAQFSKKINLTFMEIDDVFWNVGRIYCSKKSPSCHYCIFSKVCKYSYLRRLGMIKQMKAIDSKID